MSATGHFRNLKTGAVKTLDPQSPEAQKLKAERSDDGRFPLWEQTGIHDADPKAAAADYEVVNRDRWDAKVEDVTTDGILQSGPHQLAAAVGGLASRSDASAASGVPASSAAPKRDA